MESGNVALTMDACTHACNDQWISCEGELQMVGTTYNDKVHTCSRVSHRKGRGDHHNVHHLKILNGRMMTDNVLCSLLYCFISCHPSVLNISSTNTVRIVSSFSYDVFSCRMASNFMSACMSCQSFLIV